MPHKGNSSPHDPGAPLTPFETNKLLPANRMLTRKRELPMKLLRLVIPILLVPLSISAQAGSKASWADWSFLIGQWAAGDSSGVPGKASQGSFSLTPDLGGSVLVRKN